MKKYWVLFLDKVLMHLICYKTNFGFNYKYHKEILDYLCIEPQTKIIGDPWGEYHVEVIWTKPPKWYKGWMRDIEEPIANHIYNYLLKNKAIIKKYRNRDTRG